MLMFTRKVKLGYVQVITGLGGRFAINCPSAILKVLKLPE